MVATLKDIAKKTGLSVPSVSLILNGHGHKFRTESCKAVFEAADQLRYRPDMVMRRLGRASTRRDAVGFVVRSDAQSLSDDAPVHEYMCGVNDTLLDRDQLMVVLRLASDSKPMDKKPPRLLTERFIDGLILAETGLPESMEQIINHYDLTRVHLNTQRREATNCVYADNEHAGRIATQRLIELGHRRILFIPTPWPATGDALRNRYASHYREEGYRAAMIQAGLEPCCADTPVGITEHLTQTVSQIVISHDSSKPITAVVTSAFSIAIKTLAMLNSTHLRCPQDVSVVSTGDLRMLSQAWPHVTRVACDRQLMGRWAAGMLLDLLEAGEAQPSRVFRGELIPGATIAPAKF